MRTKNTILMSGNEAIAQGALEAGCRFYAGYPITPQNELIAYMADKMPAHNGIFIQSESELSAINMVFGAAAAGAKAMTSSSSPGISLKQEGISYIAGAQLPAVIVNVMRGGPGLGNIWPSQSDYFQATRSGGHGDYHCLVLAPSSVQECYNLMFEAFRLADKYINPAIVLADGMLGQMMEPLRLKEVHTKPKLAISKPWALTGCKGRKPNITKSFYMKEGDLEKFNLLLQKRYSLIRAREQRQEEFYAEDAHCIIVAYGSMARIAKNAVIQLREKGLRIGLVRPITLWPFPTKILQRLAEKRKRLRVLVVEMSYGQMVEDVRLALCDRAKIDFYGRSGGGVPTAEAIAKKIHSLLKG